MKRRWLLIAQLVVLFSISTAMDCEESKEFTLEEKKNIVSLFTNGTTFQDQFVRAETFRVINLLHDKDLSALAIGSEKDSSAMVRLVGLRVLLQSKHESARSSALNAFSQGTAKERYAVLEAAFDLGDPALKAELSARAFRGDNPQIKRMAFEQGFLARIDKAIQAKESKLLERTLLPDLGRFVSEKDPTLAALALKKLVQAGQPERADRLLKQLNDKNETTQTRLLAATILARAKISQANPTFKKLRDEYDNSLTGTALKVPGRIVPPEILKWAILGLAGSGGEADILRANKYRIKANVETSIDVLESFSKNPNSDAAIALRNAMGDARAPIRRRAIELYLTREDANAASLMEVLPSADQETRVSIFRKLVDHFSKETVPLLELSLKRTSEVDLTLKLLTDVIKNKEDAAKILRPLVPLLEAIYTSDNKERTQKARYLVAISSSDKVAKESLLTTLSENMLYGYLEFALINSPKAHKAIFRKYALSDLYSVRLISLAGRIAAHSPRPGAGSPPSVGSPRPSTTATKAE